MFDPIYMYAFLPDCTVNEVIVIGFVSFLLEPFDIEKDIYTPHSPLPMLHSIHFGNIKILWRHIHCNICSSSFAITTKGFWLEISIPSGRDDSRCLVQLFFKVQSQIKPLSRQQTTCRNVCQVVETGLLGFVWSMPWMRNQTFPWFLTRGVMSALGFIDGKCSAILTPIVFGCVLFKGLALSWMFSTLIDMFHFSWPSPNDISHHLIPNAYIQFHSCVDSYLIVKISHNTLIGHGTLKATISEAIPASVIATTSNVVSFSYEFEVFFKVFHGWFCHQESSLYTLVKFPWLRRSNIPCNKGIDLSRKCAFWMLDL
mmetsp:Transcript_1884/g.4281  ORF Transcript_1884/g.4281 Transcript_1884/m.4281 type:complete len:314 (+) Transcript_1884:191-1132(+)